MVDMVVPGLHQLLYLDRFRSRASAMPGTQIFEVVSEAVKDDYHKRTGTGSTRTRQMDKWTRVGARQMDTDNSAELMATLDETEPLAC